MTVKSKKTILLRILLYLFIIACAVLCVFPFYWQIRSALMSNSEIFRFPPRMWPESPQWSNFITALTAFNFLGYLKNTLSIMLPVLLGTVITCPLCAYAFARLHFPGQKIWFRIAMATIMLPFIVTVLPTYVMWSKLGMIDTFVPLILPAWFGGGTFNVFMLRQFIMGIPRTYDEAARLDGAGHLTILYRIIVPIIRPALVTIILFTIMNTWNDYFNPMLYLQSEERFTLVLGIVQFQGAYNSRWNLMMVVATAVLIPVIVVFFLGQKYFIEGSTQQGGLKA